MSLKYQLDLMSMFQQDQESVLNGIHMFVNDIFSGNKEEAKKKLCEKLHEITKICHCSSKTMIKPKTSITRKRSKILENVISEHQIVKKKKIECKKLPNELWLKIMNYSNTKDLINNLSLVCKNFNSLSKEVKYLELKNITELEVESAMKVLKTTKHLKEISVATKTKYSRFMNDLLIQALKSSKDIKSIKLLPTRFLQDGSLSYYTLCGFKRINNYCKELEHLQIKDVEFTSPKVISQIAQITTLKSFKISMTSTVMNGKFTKQNVLDFANNCPNLEAISFYTNIGSKNINQMKHAFDTFFNSKKQTLKSFSIRRSVAIYHYDWDVSGSCVLEKLDLCQNLEELLITSLYIQNSILETIMALPKLTTLVLRGGSLKNIKYTRLLSLMPISMNLKYLTLSYNHENNLSSFNFGFAKFKFPLLERFCTQNTDPFQCKASQSEIFAKNLYQLTDNSPNLKSIQLHGEFFHKEVFRNMSLQLCQKRNIFITFGTFTREIPSNSESKSYEEFQNVFEKNMEHMKSMTKPKYDDLKREFLDWEKRNNWWTWAMEDY